MVGETLLLVCKNVENSGERCNPALACAKWYVSDEIFILTTAIVASMTFSFLLQGTV
jgi:hypothetical protein